LAVGLFHGDLDSGCEFVIDCELLEPEGRVNELTHVLSISVAATDDIVPLLQGVDENIHVVAPVLDALFDPALLEESH
jgi:hypothetical protein